VVVEFSEAMKPETFVLGSTIRIHDGAKGLDVFGTLKFSTDAKTVTFRPTFGYGRDVTTIEVTLSPLLTDLAGNPIGNPQSWTFATAEDPNAVESNLLTESFETNAYEDTAFSPVGSGGKALWNPNSDPGNLVSTFGTYSVTIPLPAGGSSNSIPLGTGSWLSCRCQMWYKASELGNAGTISGLKFFSGSSVLQGAILSNFTVLVGHTTSSTGVNTSTFAGSFDKGTPVTVINGVSYTLPSGSPYSPIQMPSLSSTFNFDGQSNVVFDVSKSSTTGSQTWDCFSNFGSETRRSWSTTANGGQNATSPASWSTGYGYRWVVDFRTDSSQARSLFYKTEFPAYFLDPVITPTSVPAGTEMKIEWQAALDPANEQTFTSWTEDISDLDTYEYIRLRASFIANLGTGVGPKLEEFVIPYTSAPTK
jgi:hypothetical protein